MGSSLCSGLYRTGGLILGIGNAGRAAIAKVSLSYFGAGLVGGLVAGACRPLNGSRAGRWLICMLVMAPVAFSFTVYLSGAPTNWGKPEWVALAFMTVVLGPIFGSIFYRES